MKATLKLATLATLLALGAAAPVAAADLGYGIKFGVGPTLNDPKEQAARPTLNLAITGDMKLSETSELFAELNYRYFKADPRNATLYGTGFRPDGVNGGVFTISPATSIDLRRDNIEGLGLSAGYRLQLWDSAFHVQGGVSVTALKYRQEVSGSFNYTSSLYEGMNFTFANTAVKPGAFVGVQARVTSNFFVEANATWISYEKINYVPYTYSGQAPTTVTENGSKVALDLNIGFRF